MKPKACITEAQNHIKAAVNYLCDYAVKTGDENQMENIKKLGDVLRSLHNYKAHQGLPNPRKRKVKPRIFFGYNTISK